MEDETKKNDFEQFHLENHLKYTDFLLEAQNNKRKIADYFSHDETLKMLKQMDPEIIYQYFGLNYVF